MWKMDLINSCGTQDYSKQFVINTPFSYSSLPQFDGYNNDIETPIPCCPDGQDILIDYALYGSGVIEYVAISDITLENMSVASSVDKLILQAGDGVLFQSDVLINAGTEVDILIEPCLFVQ